MRYRRIGFIGDIHAEDELLERALQILQGRGVELLAATGDIADGAGSVDRCCELLARHRVLVVRGNHDRWLVKGQARDLPQATRAETLTAETLDLLRQLPEMVELETVAGTALLCHGLGPNDMAKVTPDDFGYALESNDELQDLLRGGRYRWVLNGHSHRRMVRQFGPLTIVNAGTLSRRDHEPGFLEIDFQTATAIVYRFVGGHPAVVSEAELALEAASCP